MTQSSTDYYVYGHYRKDINQLFYVGKGTGRRAWSKKSRNKHWKRIAEKHGYEIFMFCDGLLEADALALEKAIIVDTSPEANYTMGGDGGNTFLRKTSEEIREIMQKRKLKQDPKKLASFGFKGRKHTEEHKRRMSERNKGIRFSPKS